MADKTNLTPDLKNTKGNESPGKYFRAVAAWVEDADKIDDLEDIPLYGHLKIHPASTKEANNTSRREVEGLQRGPKDKAADEVNDNINVNEMLVNIMEALKEDDKGGKRPLKKKEYAPLERVKRNDPELEKPAFVHVNPGNLQRQETNKTDKDKNLNDLTVEDFEKQNVNAPIIESATNRKTTEKDLLNTGGQNATTDRNYNPFNDKFNMSEIKIDDDNLRATGDLKVLKLSDRLFSPPNQNLNPFARSLYPSAQITDNFLAGGEQGSEDKNKNAKGNRKHFESSIQSTINDLSAIAGDGIVRDNLDSRGSFIPGVTMLRGNNKDVNSQDKVLIPGIQIIGSPEKPGRNENESDLGLFKQSDTPENPHMRINDNTEGSLDHIRDEGTEYRGQFPSERFLNRRRRRSKFDPGQKDVRKEYNWIHDLRDYSHDKGKDIASMNRIRAKSKDSIDQTDHNITHDEDGDNTNDPNRKETRRNRREQVLDLLARLAVDKNSKPPCNHDHDSHDHDHDQRGRSRGKSRGRDGDANNRSMRKNRNETHRPNDLTGAEANATTKYTANFGADETQDGGLIPSARFDRNNDTNKNTTFDPNGPEALDEHFKWLHSKEKNLEKGEMDEDNNNKNNDNKMRNPGNIIDETRDTGYQKDNRKESQDITGLLGNINAGTQLTLDREYAKDEKLRDLMRNQFEDKTGNNFYPLSKKITGETDIRFDEEEEPFFVTFKKRKFNEEESVLISHQNIDDIDLSESFEHIKSVKSESRIEWEEVDEPISNTMIHLFVGMKKKVSRMEYLIQEVRKPDYTMDTFFERNFKFLKGKLQVTKNFFFIFLILTGVMLYFIFDTMVISLHF